MDEDSHLVALHPSDNDLTRAENILRVGGMVINATARDIIIPRMANAIRLYRDLDRAALEGPQDRMAKPLGGE